MMSPFDNPAVPPNPPAPGAAAAGIHPQVAAAPLEECQLLLLADAGEALVLNESAALVWHGIEAGEELAALTTRLTTRYAVHSATAQADVLALLATLAEAGALVPPATGQAFLFALL